MLSHRLYLVAVCLLALMINQGCTGSGMKALSSAELASLNPSATTTTTTTTTTLAGVAWRGTNLSGAEFNLGMSGAVYNTNYTYPTSAEVDYFAAKGFKVIRLPFDLDRLQPTKLAALDATQLGYIQTFVTYANSKGLKVILDPHNYGQMKDNGGTSRVIVTDAMMPASTFADFWTRLATVFLSNPDVVFGLMNEPYQQTAAEWKTAAVAAVTAIRATGATQKILIPGTSYTGAHSWVSSGNAAVWAGYSDSNFAFEVHQYLDSDSSGTHSTCVVGNGSTVLAAFTAWATTNNVQGFLGEIGWATNATCLNEGDSIMLYMANHNSVWLGYSYWSAGPWWGGYMFTLEPTGLGTGTVTDQPQMASILAH